MYFTKHYCDFCGEKIAEWNSNSEEDKRGEIFNIKFSPDNYDNESSYVFYCCNECYHKLLENCKTKSDSIQNLYMIMAKECE